MTTLLGTLLLVDVITSQYFLRFTSCEFSFPPHPHSGFSIFLKISIETGSHDLCFVTWSVLLLEVAIRRWETGTIRNAAVTGRNIQTRT